VDVVQEEIERLTHSWEVPNEDSPEDRLLEFLGPDRLAGIDLFDRVQLNQVLQICARSRSMSEAGRALYSASRDRKTTTNDADRLRKYLTRFGIEWSQIQTNASSPALLF
jgi:transcriptional regulatory protein RtcR